MKKLFYKLLSITQLFWVFSVTVVLMAIYEFLKETYFKGELTLWESHTITIIVTATFATLAAFFMRSLANRLVVSPF